MVGLYGELKNDAEDAVRRRQVVGRAGRRQRRPVRLQARRQRRHDEVGDTERDFFTAGIGYGFGPVNTSITYGQIFDTNSDFDEATGIGDKAYNLVFSADYAPGAGPGAGGRREQVRQRQHGDTGTGDKGWHRGRQRPPGVLIQRLSRDEGGGALPRRLLRSWQRMLVALKDTVPVQRKPQWP